MSKLTLNSNSSSTINTNTNFTSAPSPIHNELGKILRQHDPNAIRLYDFINHVKVFLYNSNEFHWENNPYIEGNLFAYQKEKIINNKIYSSFAFAVINKEKNFIQEIPSNMPEHVDKLHLFYEVIRNDKYEVFSLHFFNENQCQRLHAFINRSIQLIQDIKQSPATLNNEVQLPQTNIQNLSANIYRQQTPMRNSTAPRQTPTHVVAQQSTPVINDDNSNTEDPTSSLKRLLNIPNPNVLNNESISSKQQSIKLLPPSTFETTPSLSISTTCDNREHFHNVLFDLIQNNDQFFDIIDQAYHTHQS